MNKAKVTNESAACTCGIWIKTGEPNEHWEDCAKVREQPTSNVRAWLSDYASMLQLTLSQPKADPRKWALANERFTQVVQYLRSPDEPRAIPEVLAAADRVENELNQVGDHDESDPSFVADLQILVCAARRSQPPTEARAINLLRLFLDDDGLDTRTMVREFLAGLPETKSASCACCNDTKLVPVRQDDGSMQDRPCPFCAPDETSEPPDPPPCSKCGRAMIQTAHDTWEYNCIHGEFR